MTKENRNTIATILSCEAVVRMNKSNREDAEFMHSVAFGSVLVGDEWQPAFVPASVVKRMKPQRGATYDAKIVEGSNEIAKSGRWLVCRIEGPTEPAVSEAATMRILAHVKHLEITTSRELTLKLRAEGFEVRESDVWITLQGLWSDGLVSRLALARNASAPDHGTAWTWPDFEIIDLMGLVDD